jgi:hypothetical protein
MPCSNSFLLGYTANSLSSTFDPRPAIPKSCFSLDHSFFLHGLGPQADAHFAANDPFQPTSKSWTSHPKSNPGRCSCVAPGTTNAPYVRAPCMIPYNYAFPVTRTAAATTYPNRYLVPPLPLSTRPPLGPPYLCPWSPSPHLTAPGHLSQTVPATTPLRAIGSRTLTPLHFFPALVPAMFRHLLTTLPRICDLPSMTFRLVAPGILGARGNLV